MEVFEFGRPIHDGAGPGNSALLSVYFGACISRAGLVEMMHYASVDMLPMRTSFKRATAHTHPGVHAGPTVGRLSDLFF